MSGTVGVLAQPLAAHAHGGRYRRAVVWKANPRTPEYMRARFAEAAPGGRIVAPGAGMADALREADEVLLMYPDAIGLGWRAIERDVVRAAAPGADVAVLNGRGRRFALDARTRRALGLRRAMEWTMLLELVAAPLIVGLAPALWAVDAIRGRR